MITIKDNCLQYDHKLTLVTYLVMQLLQRNVKNMMNLLFVTTKEIVVSFSILIFFN